MNDFSKGACVTLTVLIILTTLLSTINVQDAFMLLISFALFSFILEGMYGGEE